MFRLPPPAPQNAVTNCIFIAVLLITRPHGSLQTGACVQQESSQHVLHLWSQRGYGGVRYHDAIYPKHFHNKMIICIFFSFLFCNCCWYPKQTKYLAHAFKPWRTSHHACNSQLCLVLFSLGFCRSPPLMIAGGRAFVVPCIQQIQRSGLAYWSLFLYMTVSYVKVLVQCCFYIFDM